MKEKAVLTENLKNDENGSDKLSSIGTSPSPAEFQYKRLVPEASGRSLFISNISKHRAALITPIVVLSIAIILMIVAFSAADWNGADSDKTTAKQLGESTTLVITSTETTSAPTTPTTTTTTPTTTTTTTASPTTPTTTYAPTTPPTTAAPTTSTTTTTPTTLTTTVAPTTTTLTTTTTSSSTTTEATSSVPVAYSFLLSLDEEFLADYLDSTSVEYLRKSLEICENVSNIFTATSIEYEGCLVTSIQSGSTRISFDILLKESDTWSELVAPPLTSNLTDYEYTIQTLLADGLSSIGIPGLEKENLTFAESCSQCDALTRISTSNKCATEDPCLNNGTCIEEADGSTACLCDSLHYGEFCHLAVRDCDEILCNGQGNCRRKVYSEDIYCFCNKGYSGNHCETAPVINKLPCENFTTPCSGHGACYDLSETEYLCVCNAGYNGTDCDVDINECDSNPCFHGNCTDEMNHFSCVCYDGYEGVQCQTVLNPDDCEDNLCPLNSICIDLVNNYTCKCNPGYTGKDCHSVCDDEPCFNNATCSLCDEGVCNETGLPFKCNCTEEDIYGVLCTDRDGGWNNWSEWADSNDASIQPLEGLDALDIANCSYTKTARFRECNNPTYLGAGSVCPGNSEEISDYDGVECTCIACCESGLICVPKEGNCVCDVDCGGPGNSCCLESQHVCNNTTLYSLNYILSFFDQS